MPKPVGELGGGMANAIVGTLILSGLGAMFAIPIGIVSGVYMSEYAGTRFASTVRFAADTLNGVPSIVIGVFVYGIAVLPFKQFSALAGGLALGIMMIPIIARTTEELLLLVPGTMREGALALGATRARAVFSVVLPAALRASSPASCWRSRASPAKRRRCSSPRSTTVLHHEPDAADRVAHRAGLHLRDLAVRRLAPPGLGRRARARDDRADVFDPGARRDETHRGIDGKLRAGLGLRAHGLGKALSREP